MTYELKEKIMEPQEHVPMYRFDRDTGFWGIPNIERRIPVSGKPGAFINARHNEDGNRTEPYENGSSKKRVLCFGASHTWGEGVEEADRYTNVLSRETSASFINLGHCSFGIDQICIAMIKRSRRYSPSVILVEQYPRVIHRVLLTYSSGYLKPYFYLDSSGALKLKKVPGYAGFKIYRKINGGFRQYQKELQDFKSGMDRTTGYDLMSDPIFLSWKSHYYEYMDALLDKILIAMRDFSMEIRCKLLFILLAVHQEFFDDHETGLIDYKLPSKRFKRLLDKNGIPYIDTADAILKAHLPDDPVINRDGHTNPKGHRIIAGMVRQELDRRGLIAK